MKKRKSQSDKLLESLEKTVRQYVAGKSFVPASFSDLMDKMAFPEQHRPLLKRILENLVEEGSLDKIGKNYTRISKREEFITGVLRVHSRGFGFLQPHANSPIVEDVFIPKHLTLHAVDGDTVEVSVNPELFSEKGPEGRVVAILDRGRSHVGGIIKRVTSWGEIEAYVPLLGSKKRVLVNPAADEPVKEGDRVILEVTHWGSKEADPTANVSHILGHIDDPSCDVDAAIEEFDLRDAFPHQPIEEAKKWGKHVPATAVNEREDFREWECVTIDPDTAKDFDDAITLTEDKKGHFHLGVHIADVSYYVPAGSALDKEAAMRCNSTYFPGRCIPMLPPELSENLCSLKPNVNRLAASVLMEFDWEGNLINYKMTRSVIKSQQRFTYRQALSVLKGEAESPFAPLLKRMEKLCKLLKKKRSERGSIEFCLPELMILIDKEGHPYGTDYIEYDITHQMIEEFMLKANETVASHLSKKGIPLTYRVHEEPSPENIRDFSTLARAFGFDLPETPSNSELQKLFEQVEGTPYGSFLATGFIRRMRLANYSADNIGHYGLALSHYCHFTSPIRRYVDLVVHRILFGDHHEIKHLEEVSLRCSEQERISGRAESSVTTLKKLRLLCEIKKQHPDHQFEGVVTHVKPFGFFFEVLDVMLEGFLHVSDLQEDYFTYDERKQCLNGQRTDISYSPGDTISVMLQGVDLIMQETRWHLVSEAPKKKKSKDKKRKKRKK